MKELLSIFIASLKINFLWGNNSQKTEDHTPQEILKVLNIMRSMEVKEPEMTKAIARWFLRTNIEHIKIAIYRVPDADDSEFFSAIEEIMAIAERS